MLRGRVASRRKSEIRHFSKLKHVWWGARTPAGQRRYDEKFRLFLKMCNPQRGAKILEIGSGDGEFTKRLVSLDAELVATDITPKLVDKGKKKLGQHVVFQLEDAERLSFKDTSFDIVCGVSILHHLNEKNALKEACRVLKKGGQLFFTEPNLLNPQIFLGLHIPQLRQLMEFSPDETALIRWNVAGSLTKAGFKDMVVRNYDFLHPKTPERMIDALIKASNFLEKIPLVKELSGSLVIWAKK